MKNSDKSTAPNLKSGGTSPSVTPSTALLNQMLGTSPAPRMLTPTEIELLQRSKQEVCEHVGELLAKEEDDART